MGGKKKTCIKKRTLDEEGTNDQRCTSSVHPHDPYQGKKTFFFHNFCLFSLIVLISPATGGAPHCVCIWSKHNNNNFGVRLDFAFGERAEFLFIGYLLKGRDYAMICSLVCPYIYIFCLYIYIYMEYFIFFGVFELT